MKITGPGFYKQRNGERCEVVALSRGDAIGWSYCDIENVRDATTWRISDGKWSTSHGDQDLRDYEADIVGPWTEPWEPTGRVMWRICGSNVAVKPCRVAFCDSSDGLWYRLMCEQRSQSGETRWVPVEVET